MLSDTAREVLDFVRENDVKFVRLAFCDLFGRPKNIAVMADQLPRAFEQGIPLTPRPCRFRGSRWLRSAAGTGLFLRCHYAVASRSGTCGADDLFHKQSGRDTL